MFAKRTHMDSRFAQKRHFGAKAAFRRKSGIWTRSTNSCRIFALLSPNKPCKSILKMISLLLVLNSSTILTNAPILSGQHTSPRQNITTPNFCHFLSNFGDSFTIKSAVNNFKIIHIIIMRYVLSNNLMGSTGREEP
jgi:hypothetical protein